MALTTFSGPVASTNGFLLPVTTTAALPAASSVARGTCYIITDNGAGNNEQCIVQSTGSAWVTATGAALT